MNRGGMDKRMWNATAVLKQPAEEIEGTFLGAVFYSSAFLSRDNKKGKYGMDKR